MFTTRRTTGMALLLMAGCGQPSSNEGEDPIGIQDNLTAGLIETVYVARRDTWSYWYQRENLGTAWREHAWTPPGGQTSGATPLGYGESYVNTIPYGPEPSNKPITVYFRK